MEFPTRTGTKGVGLAIAHRFAKPNADVFLNHRADDAGAEKTRATIKGSGARCHLIKGDVGTPGGAKAVLTSVRSRSNRLDQLSTAP